MHRNDSMTSSKSDLYSLELYKVVLALIMMFLPCMNEYITAVLCFICGIFIY